jgi:putative acetyltransferase
MTSSNIHIRQAKLSDLPALQQLFVGTIENVCKADYNEQQISVWTSSVENKQRWLGIIENQYVLVAQEEDRIVGFCSLDKNNYIDLFYVHKDKQGQGIARLLYNTIESEALKFGQKELTSDVSITARPFFEKIGFTIQAEQTVVREGVELTNYKMKKVLN